MAILYKLIYIFNTILSKFQLTFFPEIDMVIQSFLRKYFQYFLGNIRDPGKAKIVLKKNKSGRLIHLNFKTYYKARVTKTVWYWGNCGSVS